MRDRATATLTTVVVDDEQLACDELSYLLKDFPEVEVIATGSNGLEAVDLIQKLEPELVFLDVHMPGLDGMGVVRRLREKTSNCPTSSSSPPTTSTPWKPSAWKLWTTCSSRWTRPAWPKPSNAPAASSRTESARTPPAAPKTAPPRRVPSCWSAANSRHFIVDANDVIYATIDNGLITLVTTNLEGHSNYRTIEDLQANLDREMFWRVHRSYLVNINRIKEVVPWFKSSYQLRMDDRKHTEIPVSRVQTRRLRELFKL